MSPRFLSFIGLISMLLFPLSGQGQYEFRELGVRVGGGVNAYLPFSETVAGNTTDVPYQPSWGAGLDGWFSKYPCGKNYGYHLEVGYRHGRMIEERGSAPTLLASDFAGEADYRFHFLTARALFKWRKFTYHKRREFAIMAGPAANLQLLTRAAAEGGAFADLNDDDFHDVTPVLPGLSLQFWWRMPYRNTRDRSWFIAPGVDGFFTPLIETNADSNLFNVYAYLTVGISLWNNL